jgi:hypothetical protein
MPLVILHHLLNVSVQLANKRGFKQNKTKNIITQQNIGSLLLITHTQKDVFG